MITEDQADELLMALNRIARSLETIVSVIDTDESEFNVYVRGEVHLEEEAADEDADEEDEEEEEEEEEYEEETV